jgi:hypothetical protein
VTKADTAAATTGALSTTALGLGGMDTLLALLVAGLTVCLLLIRIGLAIREWRKK